MEYLSMKIPLIYSIQIIHSTTTMYKCTYVHTPVHIVHTYILVAAIKKRTQKANTSAFTDKAEEN